MTASDRTLLVAYAVTFTVALAVGFQISDGHPIRVAFVVDVVATCVIFGFSLAHRNSSFYDTYWSIAPPVIALYWMIGSGEAAVDHLRAALVIALVYVWAARLTWNWYRGWGGLDHEDWRYLDMKSKTGRAYWSVSFVGIHLVPTLFVFLACLPLYPALAFGTRPFGALDVFATVLTAAAIWLEARADRELFDYRRSSPPPDETLTSGVWRYSRHPNYCGEMAFWWGIALFGIAAAPEWWWSAVGALAITLMFRFISLQLIEDRMLERRPDYPAYMSRTSRVIPWPPKPEGRSA